MRYDLELIKKELATLPEYDTQLYLQGDTPDMVADEPIKNYLLVDETENDFWVPLFDIPYINSILKENNLVRTRIMKMKPKTCYYWHHDKTKRLHIPIITNKGNIMVIEDIAFHMPSDGAAYITDNTKYHNFFNGSECERVHLVSTLIE